MVFVVMQRHGLEGVGDDLVVLHEETWVRTRHDVASRMKMIQKLWMLGLILPRYSIILRYRRRCLPVGYRCKLTSKSRGSIEPSSLLTHVWLQAMMRRFGRFLFHGDAWLKGLFENRCLIFH